MTNNAEMESWDFFDSGQLDDYQRAAASTAIYKAEHAVIYPALGLAAEAGEVANKVKKIIRDDDGVLTEDKRYDIISELGDVLWYVANLASELKVDLNKVAKNNIHKLYDRKDRGVLKGSGDSR